MCSGLFAQCRLAADLNKYASWHSTSALGNALNVWMQIFLFALTTGRQLVVGSGIVPELLCGEEGAYVCGVESESNLAGQLKRGQADWRLLFSDVPVAASSASWFQYNSLNSAVMRGIPRGEVDEGFKALCLDCLSRSLRCPARNPRNGLDRESCVMVRAMQLLLPGTFLRESFSRSARLSAADRWLGLLEDLDVVLNHSAATVPDVPVGGTRDERKLFFNPPPTRLDASARFAGAIHIRAMPPKLERSGVEEHHKAYVRFLAAMNSTQSSFWVCAARNALRADERYRRDQWPRSIFVATDSDGLCRVARDQLASAAPALWTNPVACMDVSPVHLVKATRAAAHVAGGLDSHQLTILDWHLLARSRWLVSVSRVADRCHRGAARDGAHGVGGPGKSFYGWALAASGLAHPPRDLHFDACPCHLDDNSVSMWYVVIIFSSFTQPRIHDPPSPTSVAPQVPPRPLAPLAPPVHIASWRVHPLRI